MVTVVWEPKHCEVFPRHCDHVRHDARLWQSVGEGTMVRAARPLVPTCGSLTTSATETLRRLMRGQKSRNIFCSTIICHITHELACMDYRDKQLSKFVISDIVIMQQSIFSNAYWFRWHLSFPIIQYSQLKTYPLFAITLSFPGFSMSSSLNVRYAWYWAPYRILYVENSQWNIIFHVHGAESSSILT